MRHRVKSKNAGRNKAHLDAMLRNMATSIVLHEKIETTAAKAKLIKPVLDKLIARAKKSSVVEANRDLNAYLLDKNATKKVMRELLDRYKDRPSGFLRLTRAGFRAGDGAPMMQIELV